MSKTAKTFTIGFALTPAGNRTTATAPNGHIVPAYDATVNEQANVILPEAEGDHAVYVPPVAGLNSRTLFRLDGVWHVQWPGFKARKADVYRM